MIKFEHTSIKKNMKKYAHIRMPGFLEKRIWTASIILEKSPKFLSVLMCNKSVPPLIVFYLLLVDNIFVALKKHSSRINARTK